jgi:GR25 family glycosyltransferase involved in LPS biosynthesis
MDKEVLDKVTFEVFHTNTGNLLRNKSYNHILDVMSSIPRLGSPTYYLNTKEKAEEYLAQDDAAKINTVIDYAQPGETFPPSSGVVGVWASNYEAYKAFLETDKEYLIIFEDDVVLSKNFLAVLETYLIELPYDWDFFSFFVPDDSLFAYNQSHDIGQLFVCRSYQQWSCAGYVVSRQGAENVLRKVRNQGASAPIDWFIFNFRMKKEENQPVFETYTLKPHVYKPIKFLLEAAQYSQIHNGSTEVLV